MQKDSAKYGACEFLEVVMGNIAHRDFISPFLSEYTYNISLTDKKH